MSVDIQKAENGWMLIQNFANRGERRYFIFQTLPELAQWIIANAENP